jgi:hypothetical protein
MTDRATSDTIAQRAPIALLDREDRQKSQRTFVLSNRRKTGLRRHGDPLPSETLTLRIVYLCAHVRMSM